MTPRVLRGWESLRESYWFLPATMIVAAAALAAGTLELDRALTDGWTAKAGWVYTGGPDGARALLATVASATVTVAGVVFSITIVALSLRLADELRRALAPPALAIASDTAGAAPAVSVAAAGVSIPAAEPAPGIV